MVGKKWRKAAAVGIAGVLAVGVLAGCVNVFYPLCIKNTLH